MLTIFPLVFRTFKRCCRFLRVEKDLVAMTEKAAQNDALKVKVEALQGQLDVKKSLALLKERMASADGKLLLVIIVVSIAFSCIRDACLSVFASSQA